jgi:methylenetetrahydrofolate reductase (NADPH)
MGSEVTGGHRRPLHRQVRDKPCHARVKVCYSATVRIDEIIAGSEEPVFSFEFFPPKTDEGERNLREALETLVALAPDYVSVTYGAGGSTRNKTVELTKWIKQELGIEAMAHLSCVGATREELGEILDGMRAAGIQNVLALRGDPPRGEAKWTPHPGGLHYSTELAALISKGYPFSVGAACFPEVHPEAPDMAHDLRFLKDKVQNGASFLITQLFFDNELYFRFVAEARAVGIEVPIIPGIMPITDLRQIKTITGMCGATIPPRLLEALEWRSGDADAVLQLGVSHATLQCAELLAQGAPGIHFYTLNRSPATRAILSALRLLRPWAGRAHPPPALAAPV